MIDNNNNVLSEFGEYFHPKNRNWQFLKEDLIKLHGIEDQKEVLGFILDALKNFSNNSDNFKELDVEFTALLIGPSGTGKTAVVKALAKQYQIPLLIVFGSSILSSKLGESQKHVKKLFNQIREAALKSPHIIFFDEFDSIARERGDKSDISEMKRVVIEFMQNLDKIKVEQLPIALFAATNHEKQLDSAIFRRFAYKTYFKLPDAQARYRIIEDNLKYYIDKNILTNIKGNIENLIQISESFTPSDIKNIFNLINLEFLATNSVDYNKIIKYFEKYKEENKKIFEARKELYYIDDESIESVESEEFELF